MTEHNRREADKRKPWTLAIKLALPAAIGGLGGFTIGQNNPPPSAMPPAITVEVKLDRKLLDHHIKTYETENR